MLESDKRGDDWFLLTRSQRRRTDAATHRRRADAGVRGRPRGGEMEAMRAPEGLPSWPTLPGVGRTNGTLHTRKWGATKNRGPRATGRTGSLCRPDSCSAPVSRSDDRCRIRRPQCARRCHLQDFFLFRLTVCPSAGGGFMLPARDLPTKVSTFAVRRKNN